VDKLLTDAKISKSLDTDKQALVEKCVRLKNLGFISTKEVKEANEEIKRIENLKRENENKKELIKAIDYFSFHYPNYKFITEDSVKRICEKYGLVYGPVKKYTGTVPDKNLEHIEKFSVRDEDKAYLHLTSFGIRRRDTETYITISDYQKYILKWGNKSFYESHHWERVGECVLEIAAPLKDFDMEESELKDFKISKIQVPDPVVLQPVLFNRVKHYLIVTAWGLEASDPIVVNQKFN
jgi:hypothetical protein